MKNILHVLISDIGIKAFEIMLFTMFMDYISEVREDRKNGIIAYYIAALALFMVEDCCCGFINLLFYGGIFNLIINGMAFLILQIPYVGSIKTKMSYAFIYELFYYTIEILVTICMYMVSSYNSIEYTTMMTYSVLITASLLKLVVYLLFFIINGNRRKGYFEVNTVMVIMPIVSIIVLYCCTILYNSITWEYQWLMLIIIIGSLFLNLSVYCTFYSTQKLFYEKHEVLRLRQEIESSRFLYEHIQEGQSELRNIRHDLKNRLIGLYDIIENKNYIEAIQYLNMILSNIEEATQMQYCENMLVNVILNYKKQNMNTKTRFETKINIPKEISIEKGDLGVILGNLLDNSVEACNNHVEREKPYIYVNIAMEANMFIICVENSISTVNKELCKKDLVNHGRGLKNVRRLVEKYNGTMEIEKCENSFKVEIMLLL